MNICSICKHNLIAPIICNNCNNILHKECILITYRSGYLKCPCCSGIATFPPKIEEIKINLLESMFKNLNINDK